MTIPASSTHLACQNCGSLWPKADSVLRPHFRPSDNEDKMNSPAIIYLMYGDMGMEHCPKCPLPRVDQAMKEGDRTGDSSNIREVFND